MTTLRDVVAAAEAAAATAVAAAAEAGTTTDALVAGRINDADSDTRAALNATLVAAVGTVNVVDYGADPTGATDSRTAILAAISAVAEGGTVYFPAGSYLLSGAIANSGKSVRLVGYGATLVQGANAVTLDLSGGFEATQAVSSITTVPPTNPDRNHYTVLNFTNSLDWQRGDVVKVIGNDVIPEARPGSGGNESRVGQFAVVESRNGSGVTIVGLLRDTFTTGIRVARLSKAKVSVEGLTLDVTDAALGAGYTAGALQLRSLAGPVVKDVSVARALSHVASVQSCYGYEFDNYEVGYAQDDGTTFYGYGIIDSSSYGGNIHGCRFRRVRHAFTDDTSRIASGSTSVHLYGRSYGAHISDCITEGASSTAYDTHSCGEGHTFADVTAVNSPWGVGLRGKAHKVDGAHLVDCYRGVTIFNEVAGGDSYGHDVANVTGHGFKDQGVAVDLRPTGHPSAGTRETRLSSLRNIHLTNVTEDGLWLSNALVHVDNVSLGAAGTVPSSSAMVTVTNSVLEGAELEVDYRANTVGSSLRIINVDIGTVSSLDLADVRVRSNADFSTRVTYLTDNASSMLARVTDAVLDYAPATGYYSQPPAAGGWFDYVVLNSRESSRYYTASQVNTGALAGVRQLTRSFAPVVTLVSLLTSANQTLFKLEAGRFFGQQLLIVNNNASGFTLTIQHGAAAGLTTLAGGTNKVLAAGDSMLLTYTPLNGGTWLQVK